MDSIHLPNAIAFPNAFGAPGTPLPPGQVVQALVLALIESDVFRLQLPQAVVDVRSDVPLTPGSTITLALKSGGANPKLVIYSDAPAAAPAGQGVVPSLAGRHAIGEAVIVARAPALPQAGVPARIATEPAIARDAPSIGPARPVEPPIVRALTPELVVGEAVRVAASRQSGLAPLFADVEQVVQAANVLPTPVRAAANDLLALRVPLDAPITAAGVKQAFVRSGVLFEPRLAAARAAPAVDTNSLAPVPASDLKAALLVFRQVLKVWSASEPAPSRPVMSAVAVANGAPEIAARPAPSTGEAAIKHLATALTGAPEEPMPSGAPLSPEQATNLAKTVASALSTRDTLSQPAANQSRPPPPYRGAPEEPMPGGAPLSPEQATILAKTVASALTARDTPSQPAANQSGPPPPYRGAPLAAQAAAAPSIAPDASPHEIADRLIAQTDGALARQTLLQVASMPDQPDMPRAEASQRWTFEIPFATPQGTSIAQFEVSRDGRTPPADAQARTWRARFSLDVEPMGPVHALIALAGARASVTLWAERATSASRLQDSAPLLSEALRAAELEPADFQLRVGAPPAVRQAAPGRFMDRAT